MGAEASYRFAVRCGDRLGGDWLRAFLIEADLEYLRAMWGNILCRSIGPFWLQDEGTILDGRIMAKGSTRVIIVALTGNLAIALAKFIASWISGSTAMLTEAIHSLADTDDQVLFTRSEETRLLVRHRITKCEKCHSTSGNGALK